MAHWDVLMLTYTLFSNMEGDNEDNGEEDEDL